MREGIKHKLYVDYILDGALHFAPIGDHPQKIVDLGTGVGFWACDVAEHYPSARVIGTDISPIQPHWTPPNVEFRVEDLEDEHRPWTHIYEDADFMHIRAFLQTVRNPQRIVARAFENLKPGGWIECHEVVPEAFTDQEVDMSTHPLNRLYSLIDGPFTRIYGWNLQISRQIPELLSSAGFVNVNVKKTKVPLGRWHSDRKMREMGMFLQDITEDWACAFLGRPDTMGLGEADAVRLIHELSDAFRDGEMHAYLDWVDVWAQKPL